MPTSTLSSAFRKLSLTLILAIATAVSTQAQIIVASASDNTPAFLDGSIAESRLFNLGLNYDFLIKDITFTINFSKQAVLFDDPPFYDSFALTLGAFLPNSLVVGPTINLINFNSFNPGAFGDSFAGTLTFDRNALLAVNHNPDALSPGTFRPVDSLSLLNNLTNVNQFEMRLVSGTSGAPLTYYSSQIDVGIVAVPEPSTYGLVGAALLGASILIRRRVQSTTSSNR